MTFPSWRSFGALTVLLSLLGGTAAQSQEIVLSAPEANALVVAGKMTLVDVRTPEEWRQTGVPAGAKRLDYQNRTGQTQFVEHLTQAIGGDRSTPVAIICRSGNRSTQVQRLLIENGFTHVVNIREGMLGSDAGPGWLRRGLPVIPCPMC
ncbi:rhodanese-like domain-containing protein [Magnetospirillum molischianum]|uniref:Rhodanese-related sulfurtransferase n=1 Tax=Magnetospirillum molischianum DSM 120 TaxID=1150626 RepID=H8FPX4_MAGML|nr:rhodanese-like domain-containing protein [Magnetospirillum molischianum]CCG40412.1 Rhodanese-related sulfurtransferase [Magnetospirillum molischianum DSM 120]